MDRRDDRRLVRSGWSSLVANAARPRRTERQSVERIKAAGAIIIGKTNTPEFGAGSQTFNAVFGATRNPYDLTRTCGGSTGRRRGGGRLRDDAARRRERSRRLAAETRPSFCNVVGFRPSFGRVPAWPKSQPWTSMSVDGPVARSVGDVALLLSVMAGPDPRSPVAHRRVRQRCSAARSTRDFKGTRVAWSRNLGRYPGRADRQPGVRQRAARVRRPRLPRRRRRAGFQRRRRDVPDASGVVVRAGARRGSAAASRSDEGHGDLEHRAGTEADRPRRVARGSRPGRRWCGASRAFLERYEFLLLPVSQVAPFPVDVEWVKEINGVKMATYIDWMGTCYAISLTGLPAISVPCGFTAGRVADRITDRRPSSSRSGCAASSPTRSSRRRRSGRDDRLVVGW